MKKNIGIIDTLIRLAIAAVIAVLYYLGIITGTLGIVLLVFAGVIVISCLMSFCPLYRIFGFSTNKVKETTDAE